MKNDFETTPIMLPEILLKGPDVFHHLFSKVDLDQWNSVAAKLTTRLRSEGSASFRRVHHYYLPLLFWLAEQVRSASLKRPLMVGLCAPQGAGKSTLTKHLVELSPELGLRAASLSIDDFYLTRQEQIALAARHPDNPYLQQRGYPGTHDVNLGLETLEKLRALGDHASLPLPTYDKAVHSGLGDRKPTSDWPAIQGPLDFVLLEGWMLGFQPVPSNQIHDAYMEAINAHLAPYNAWLTRLDAFILLKPLEIRYTVDWRIEAEEKMKASGRPGMSREAIEAYIKKFLPAYETYLPSMPSYLESAFVDRHVTLTLAKDRCPYEA